VSLVEKAIKRLAETRAREQQVSVDSTPPYGPPGVVKSLRQPQHVDSPVEAEVQPQRQRRQIDFAALRASGMLAAEHERRLFSQVFRGMKRPLLAKAALLDSDSPENARANVVMVASTVSGDGKTFTAINLALSLALERDKQVVLIDGDVVKRELSRRLGFASDGGLIELLQDSSRPLDEYLIQTDVPNLSVLPAGGTSIHATELLSSTRMQALVDQISHNPDCLVIFDSPPLLLTTESQAIAAIAGQALLVVRHGETSKEMLARALPMLQVCPSVSLVLNQSLSLPNSGYGYEYGKNDQN
jgi:protein-tyrosine kinase